MKSPFAHFSLLHYNFCMQKHSSLLLALLIPLSLQAQDLESKLGEELFKANINTLLIFTSQDGLNTGRYHFKKVNTKMDVAHLPFLYHFHSNTHYNWFILGNVGYSRVYLNDTRKDPSTKRVLTSENNVQTYTAGIGGGLRYKYTKELSVLGGVELIYSRAGVSVKPKKPLGEAIEGIFESNYNDNLTYKFMLRAEYEKRWREYRPYLKIDLDTYDTKSDFTFKSLSKIHSQSSLVAASLGVESPKIYKQAEKYLTLEAYYHYNYLFGSIKDIVKFDTYSTLGSVLYYYTPKSPETV